MKGLLVKLVRQKANFYKLCTKRKLRELVWTWKKMAVLYAATFLFVLPLLCHNLTNSIYAFHFSAATESARQMARVLNDERVRVAERFLSNPSVASPRRGATNAVWSPTDDIQDIDVAITIVTVSREGNMTGGYKPRYLTQAVWRFISLLQKQDVPYSVVLSICNVDRNPNAYVEAIHLANIVRTFTRHISPQAPSNETLEKEKDDYVYCLRTTVALRRPRYVLLVEDDALPNAHMTTVLGHVLRTRLNRKYARGDFWDSDDDIAYVKFYHPDWLLGYGSFDPNRLSCLLAIGAVASSLILAVVRCISSSLVRERDLYVTWTLLAIYTMLVATAVGRSNIVHGMCGMFPPYLYSTAAAPSCCTQAVLFPAVSALRVADYLGGVKCKEDFGKDTALEQFVRVKGMRAYFVEPNTFSHVGMYSTLSKDVLDPGIVDVS